MKEIINIYGGKHLTETEAATTGMHFILTWTMKKFCNAEEGCVSTERDKRKERIKETTRTRVIKEIRNNNCVLCFFLKLARIWSIIDLDLHNFDFSNRSDFPRFVLFSLWTDTKRHCEQNEFGSVFWFLKSYDNWKGKRRRTPILHRI